MSVVGRESGLCLEAIIALLDGSELVNRQTDWFTLRDARLQLRPYRAEGIASLLSVPLPVHGRTAGTLVFYYRAGIVFHQRLSEFFSEFFGNNFFRRRKNWHPSFGVMSIG